MNTLIPGDRFILGTADSTPPDADFDRLRRIAERVALEGRLPLRQSGKTRLEQAGVPSPKAMVPPAEHGERFSQIQHDLMDGDENALRTHVQDLLAEGVPARDILSLGLIRGMLRFSDQFMNGEIFIPEVLFAARAMNGALAILEPCLTEADRVARH